MQPAIGEIDFNHQSQHADFAHHLMSDICGQHQLSTRCRNELNFKYVGMRFPQKRLAIGSISYGANVAIHVANLGAYTISLPTQGRQCVDSHGMQFIANTHQGVIVSGNDTQDLLIDKDCIKLQVVIPVQSIEQTLAHMLQKPLHEAVVFDPEMYVNSQPAIGVWWKHIRHFLQSRSHYTQFSGMPMLAADYENLVIKSLLLSQEHNYSAALRQLNQQPIPKHIQYVHQFILTHARNPICVDDLVRLAGVSKSKLYEEFKLYYGTSPMSYLRQYRLQQIHTALKNPLQQQKLSISQLAYEWGFTHLSRFSEEYRQEFGENPSETKLKAIAH